MNLQARLTSFNLINKHKDETWDEGKNNELGLGHRQPFDGGDFSDDPKVSTNAYSGRSKVSRFKFQGILKMAPRMALRPYGKPMVHIDIGRHLVFQVAATTTMTRRSANKKGNVLVWRIYYGNIHLAYLILSMPYLRPCKSYLCVIRVKRWHETYYYFYPQSSFSGVLAIESLDISASWKQLGIWTAIGCQRSPQPQF
ncbi:hypothetical protein B0H10DRAFT_1963999 [Mycena sp. CBHHK59/15]|nr:hypothetical protein B0H10DRAFT_1963999 [Mycena sp. CBHHK59/15]